MGVSSSGSHLGAHDDAGHGAAPPARCDYILDIDNKTLQSVFANCRSRAKGAGADFPKSEANSNCHPGATSAAPTTGIRRSLLDNTVLCRPLTLCLLGWRRLGIVPSRQLGLAPAWLFLILLTRGTGARRGLFLILLMRRTGMRRGLFLTLLMRDTGRIFGSYAPITVGDFSLRANERAHPGRLSLELRNECVADIHTFGRLASFTLVVLYCGRCRRA
jgi:hypothetical protein